MALPVAPNPLAYLSAPIRRDTHGPRLYWVDETTGQKNHVAVDVVTSLEHTQSSTVTQFPVQDGTTYSDHIIHFPDQLKLEIVQTNEPFEDTDPRTGDVIVFGTTDIELDLPKTSFVPRGLLLLTLLAENAAGAGLNALASVTGLNVPGSSSGPTKVQVQKPTNFRDRINELIDQLTLVRLRGQLLSLIWLGKFWSGLAIETFNYRRAAGTTKGMVSLTLTQVNVTTTDTAQLTTPSELRLKPETAGGSKQAVKPTSAETKAIEEESALHAIIY